MPRVREKGPELVGDHRLQFSLHPLDQDENELIAQPAVVTQETAWEYGVDIPDAPEEVLTA